MGMGGGLRVMRGAEVGRGRGILTIIVAFVLLLPNTIYFEIQRKVAVIK